MLHKVKLLFLAHATDNYFWKVESITLAFPCFVKESLVSDTFGWFSLVTPRHSLFGEKTLSETSTATRGL